MAARKKPNVLVNIDVSDLEVAIRFYGDVLGLVVGRRFEGSVEMLGAACPIYLLEQDSGSHATSVGDNLRDFRRHWTPVHLDFVVPDVQAAVKRALAAGAKLERDVTTHAYGRLALLADPFGNGFCLLEFIGRGYDEIAV